MKLLVAAGVALAGLAFWRRDTLKEDTKKVSDAVKSAPAKAKERFRPESESESDPDADLDVDTDTDTDETTETIEAADDDASESTANTPGS
jgi:hypothetical protein